jgi:uncharacterized membrane protein
MSEGSKNQSTNTLMAILCYFWILVLIPWLTDAKNDPFVKFHIKQGLVLLIANIICSFIIRVPVIGWLLGIILFVLFVIGIINAATGKQTPLPIIGQFAEKIKI